MLSFIYEKFPLFYILFRYNLKKPLFKQPALLAIIAILMFSLFNHRVNSLDAVFTLTEILFYFCMMALFINVNNNLTEINDGGFLNRATLTNQSTQQILTGLYMGSSAILIILIIFLLLIIFLFHVSLNQDLAGATFNILSKINLIVFIVSLAIMLSSYVRINIFSTIIFYVVFITFSVRETGLLGFIFGVKTSLLNIRNQIYIPSDSFSTIDIILNEILIKESNINYVSNLMSIVFQTFFSVILFKTIFDKYNNKSASFIENKNIYLIVTIFYSMFAIYVLTPQVEYVRKYISSHGIYHGSSIGKTLNNDTYISIRETINVSEAYILYEEDGKIKLFGKDNGIIINKEEIDKLPINNQQKLFLENTLKEKYDFSEIEELFSSFIDKNTFTTSESILIIRSLVNFTPIIENNTHDLLKKLRVLGKDISGINAAIDEINEKVDGYLFKPEQIIFTFFWILFLSSLVFLNGNFRAFFLKKKISSFFEVAKHYYKYLVFFMINLATFFIILILSQKSISLIIIYNLIKDNLPIIIYMPLTFFSFYLLFNGRHLFNKALIYFNMNLLFLFFAGLNFKLEFLYKEGFLITELILFMFLIFKYSQLSKAEENQYK